MANARGIRRNGSAVSLCVAGAGHVVKIATLAFTLAWTHTIEKTQWEEDWILSGDRLAIVEARVEGSGAGMEPPSGSVLKDGKWRWHPQIGPLPEVVLRRAPQAGDWRLCIKGACRTIGSMIAGNPDPVRLYPCE